MWYELRCLNPFSSHQSIVMTPTEWLETVEIPLAKILNTFQQLKFEPNDSYTRNILYNMYKTNLQNLIAQRNLYDANA